MDFQFRTTAKHSKKSLLVTCITAMTLVLSLALSGCGSDSTNNSTVNHNNTNNSSINNSSTNNSSVNHNITNNSNVNINGAAIDESKAPEEVLNEFIDAVYDVDYDKALRLMPDIVYDMEKDELLADLSSHIERREEERGKFEGVEFSWNITDSRPADGEDLVDVQAEYAKEFGLEVSAVMIYEIDITFRYEGKEDTDPVTLGLLEIDGEWYMEYRSTSNFLDTFG